MGRKSKQAGSGHMPLTHYERTKKFASSNYGTTTTRLSGDTQVAFGHCSLSLAPIVDEDGEVEEEKQCTIAMVSPSGHLYSKQAIYEYLLTKTQEYQEQLQAYEQYEKTAAAEADMTEANKRKRQEDFEASQALAKKSRAEKKESVLKRTSYWLPDMQPAKVDAVVKAPERPASPYSGEPLRRKDLRELALWRMKGKEDVLCAVSGKPIRNQQTMAYWTKDKSKKGAVVLKDVFDLTIADGKKKSKDHDNKKTSKLICPLTNAKIKHTIELKSGGSGFAAHNAVEVKTYKPTIT